MILLVNPNRMLPPIAPLGLEYVAESLKQRGFEPVLCDLTFHADWKPALRHALLEYAPDAIGFSIRNIDDAYFASRDFVLETTREMIQFAMALTRRPVVLGGVGFSAAPYEILSYTGAPYGIAGDGEGSFPLLLECLAAGAEPAAVPGAVYRRPDGGIAVSPPHRFELGGLSVSRRNFVDTVRYFAEGGQAGIETLRGCPNLCVYCVDPLAKGRTVRVRPADHIAAECRHLLDQGVDTLHLCDCEFNLAPEHVYAMCDALVSSGLARRLRWYTYASVVPFDDMMAAAAKKAGCVGINFGVDHGHPEMLRRLRRSYTPDDIRRAARACRNNGIAVMFDTLLGGPGETRETLATAIDLMRECDPDRVGLSCGVRIYPRTPLADIVRAQGDMRHNPNLHGQIENNGNLLRPIFYVDGAVGADIHRYVGSLVAGDRRFLHADPDNTDGNYNYNNHSSLARAIRAGARGAYWDILRREG